MFGQPSAVEGGNSTTEERLRLEIEKWKKNRTVAAASTSGQSEVEVSSLPQSADMSDGVGSETVAHAHVSPSCDTSYDPPE